MKRRGRKKVRMKRRSKRGGKMRRMQMRQRSCGHIKLTGCHCHLWHKKPQTHRKFMKVGESLGEGDVAFS